MAYCAMFQGTTNETQIEVVKESLVELARRSRKEPGTIRYEFYQFVEQPATFLLFGIWENEDGWRSHVAGPAHVDHVASLPEDAWAIRPQQTVLPALDEIV